MEKESKVEVWTDGSSRGNPELFTDGSSRGNYYQKSMFVDKDVLRNRKLNEIL